MTALYISLGVLVVFSAVYLFMISPRLKMKKSFPSCSAYAHRGLHGDGIPENSMTAFCRAVEAGYGIELDVWLTSDKQLVVFHDGMTGRMCGTDKKITDCTYNELSELTLGGSDEHIPLFSDVLKLINGRVPLLVELKSHYSEYDLCPYVAEALDGYDNYIIESFNPFILKWFKENKPNVIRGQLSTDFAKGGNKGAAFFAMRFLLTDFLCRPDFIAYDKNYRNNISVAILRVIFKVPVLLWTTGEGEEYKEYSGVIFEKK